LLRGVRSLGLVRLFGGKFVKEVKRVINLLLGLG
jgi:hypothetical protein